VTSRLVTVYRKPYWRATGLGLPSRRRWGARR